MKKPIIAAIVALAVIGVVAFVITQSPKWSLLEYEAVVKEHVVTPSGEERVVVERTTDRYGDPLNSLGIGVDTKILDEAGNAIGLQELTPGSEVRVTLEDSFVEETPFYYPSVHEIRLI